MAWISLWILEWQRREQAERLYRAEKRKNQEGARHHENVEHSDCPSSELGENNER